MREDHLKYLVCPHCLGELRLRAVTGRKGTIIETGELACQTCPSIYPIVRYIPRMVSEENYALNFGVEWLKHSRTQYDSYTGINLSGKRFFQETGWPTDLRGQTILEVGSGSGRFTEPAAATGAFIISMDYSQAVEANFQSNGQRENVLVVQADVYRMPFHPRSFDKVFAFGMLQHTPDPHKAFLTLPQMLKEGGELVIDIYKKTFFTTILNPKYYVRFITAWMEPEKLYKLTKMWINFMWPICKIISKLPRIGPSINWRLLVADYSSYGLKEDLLKEWAYLDSFDMLSPRYDYPQTLATVRQWFEEAELTDVVVEYGYNGIQSQGKIKRCAA